MGNAIGVAGSAGTSWRQEQDSSPLAGSLWPALVDWQQDRFVSSGLEQHDLAWRAWQIGQDTSESLKSAELPQQALPKANSGSAMSAAANSPQDSDLRRIPPDIRSIPNRDQPRHTTRIIIRPDLRRVKVGPIYRPIRPPRSANLNAYFAAASGAGLARKAGLIENLPCMLYRFIRAWFITFSPAPSSTGETVGSAP